MDITVSYKTDGRRVFLSSDQFPENTDVSCLNLKLILKDPTSQISMIPKVYTIFQQAARNYGEWSDYLEHHGCACCSLTTMLRTFQLECRELTPEQTIQNVEKRYFTTGEWHKNYDKKMKKQMPVTLNGISKILKEAGVSNHYIKTFDDQAAWFVIRAHLEKGRPVIVETSQIRYKNRKVASLFDKKYAGSYHTLILLGMEEDRETVWFADSARRDWSGNAQRVKRAKLEDMINYMFPCKNAGADNNYFDRRANTGGYILID